MKPTNLVFWLISFVSSSVFSMQQCGMFKLIGKGVSLNLPFPASSDEGSGLKSKLLVEQEQVLAEVNQEVSNLKGQLTFQSFIHANESNFISRLGNQSLKIKDLNPEQIKELERLSKDPKTDKWVAKKISDCLKKKGPFPAKLNEQEVTELTRKAVTTLEKAAEHNKKVVALQFIEKAKLLKWSSEQMDSNPEFKSITEDTLRTHSLLLPEGSPQRSQLASLVLGGKLSEEPETARKLARHLKNSGYRVLFDADSPLAEVIAQELGAEGIGISASSRRSKIQSTPVFNIENPHSRMQVLSQAEKSIVSPDSLSGMGVLLLKKSGVNVIDTSGNWKNPLAGWAKDLDEAKLNQGIGYKKTTTIDMAHPGEFLPKIASDYRSDLSIKNLSDLSYDSIYEILKHTVTMVNGKRDMPEVGGAVYYGSAGYGKYDRMVQSVAGQLSKRGVPATTGGAGGSMLIVNHAAYAAGTDSLGIPIGGRHKLATEAVTYTDYHSKTILASSYDSRVPLLGYGRELVVINPGGMGTTREMATTLFDWAAKSDSKQPLLFVGSEYYTPLVKLLQNGSLPGDVASRIAVVDSAEAADKKINQWIAEGRININNFQASVLPIPRLVKPLDLERLDK